MGQSFSWEANSYLACQEIFRLLYNPKAHKSLPILRPTVTFHNKLFSQEGVVSRSPKTQVGESGTSLLDQFIYWPVGEFLYHFSGGLPTQSLCVSMIFDFTAGMGRGWTWQPLDHILSERLSRMLIIQSVQPIIRLIFHPGTSRIHVSRYTGNTTLLNISARDLQQWRSRF